MTILIPMAGEGSRFINEGYSTPKPLIPVDEIPMVIRAVNDLPNADKHIFICRDFHIKEFAVDKEIKKFFPRAEIISLDYLTEGQASTCLLGESYIDPEDELIIGACDNGMIFNQELFAEKKGSHDVLAFTFRNNVTVIEKPNQYGWMITNAEGKITDTSIKKAISDEPMTDHAVVGAFWFKKGQYFFDASKRMIEHNRRVNNEFYVDECMKDAAELGLKTAIFEIDKYLCWGTPNDYRSYNYWKGFFAKISQSQ